jgi:dipeptidyl aminopeptidase/acylaminoacyl peptidase
VHVLSLLIGSLCYAGSPVIDWLVLGPVPQPAPAFQEGKTAAELEGRGLGQQIAWPVDGDVVRWPSGSESRWTASSGPLKLGGEPGHHAWLASYLTVDRFATTELSLAATQPTTVWVDGEEVVSYAGPKDDKDKPKKNEPQTGTVHLAPGTHAILVRTAHAEEGPWKIRLSTDNDAEVGTDPRHSMRIADLLRTQTVTGLRLKPDGTKLAVDLKDPSADTEHSHHWTEIRSAADGALLRRLDGVSGLRWSHDGQATAWTRSDDEGTSLWVQPHGDAPVRLLHAVPEFDGFQWVPDGQSLVYSVGEVEEEDETGVKRLRGTFDRWPWGRRVTHLHQVRVPDGTTRRLTGGEQSVSLLDISPDSRTLLVKRETWDTAERPFSREQIDELDLKTLQTQERWAVTWFGGAEWSPDGAQMLVLGGPSTFGGVAEGVEVPNEYDAQLYLVDGDGEPRPVSRDFDPSISHAQWRADGTILAKVTDGEQVALYTFNPADDSWTPVNTGVENVDKLAIARSAQTTVWLGASSQSPHAVYTDGGRALFTPDAERWDQVQLGEVVEYDAKVGEGVIEGHVHLPPDFDPSQKYPVVVKYYGGTFPTTRGFGGRYPSQVYAAHGYVVYTVQPSGAVGYGQGFSARHVNDWGKTTADEVIGATQAFLADHPYADPDRVACIGASYGGFLTMLLVTQTDLFAAATSHAGISNLAAYWGEGWWGHLYSAAATANSYPWNAPLYTEQSPIWSADTIETPLLLLHGTDDMNVPLGESDAMYTALKVLGKEVEYVQIEGQGHWVLDLDKRERWMHTILAWWAYKLQDDDTWWRHLYPDTPASDG